MHLFTMMDRISWAARFVLATFAVVLVLLGLGIQNTGQASSWRSQFQALKSARNTSLPSRFAPGAEGLANPTSSTWKTLKSQENNYIVNKESVSNEEDEKCLSRTRHWKFREPDRRHRSSSLNLDVALSQYTSMHARCTAGKNWEEFVPSRNDSCKYLMYMEGREGLGNRLLSLVSAFTYALVTDRVLLLDSRRNMPGLLCEPFRHSSWALPENFPYNKVDGLPSLNGRNQLEKLQTLPALNVRLKHVQSSSEQRFFCPDVQRMLDSIPWIGWSSNQYYVPRLLMIPKFWVKLGPLIDGDPSRVFTQLGRFLLLPQNSIWAQIERVFQASLAKSRELVGIQLRTAGARSFEQPIQDRIMRCLVGDGILPKLSNGEAGLKSSKEVEVEKDKRGVTIFIASLQRRYFEKIRELYEVKGAEDGTLVRVHTMAADLKGQESRSEEQAVSAFVDMWLLSFSDSLVTSGWSTFGYVAQGLGGVQPYIINTDHEQTEFCGVVGQSAEPCNHFPFLSACSEWQKYMSNEHAMWIERHVKACPDEFRGLQLVSNHSV